MANGDALVVAKVGGSLLDLPALADRLEAFLATYRDRRMVLIVGGGGAADWVRGLDRIHGLGDSRAHALAVRALDLTAHALVALVPGLEVAETVAELETIWGKGFVPILAPRLPLDDDDRDSGYPLPKSWDVTTDSIAARLADRLGSSTLVLLKSVFAPGGTTRESAAMLGLVDPMFPAVARAVPEVLVVNLREAGAVPVPLD